MTWGFSWAKCPSPNSSNNLTNSKNGCSTSDRLLEYEFLNLADGGQKNARHNDRETDKQSQGMDIPAGKQNKNHDTAHDEPKVVLDQHHAVGGQVRRCQRFLKGSVKHVKIDGNQQSAGNNAFGKIKRGEHQSDQSGNPQ